MSYQLFFTLSYDGSSFSGWQQQKNSQGIADRLEAVLSLVLREPQLLVRGASRTDKGVHAFAQAAVALLSSAKVDEMRGLNKQEIAKKLFSINQLLSPAIKIDFLALIPLSFQVQYHVLAKAYLYYLYMDNLPSPLFPWAWAIGSCDMDSLRQLLSVFLGEHDFKAFGKQRSTREKNTVRHISSIDVAENGPVAIVRVVGNGFLHHQIRVMVGTAINLAKQSQLTLEEGQNRLRNILQLGDRKLAGKTAPAQSLFLQKVYYPEHLLEQCLFLTQPGPAFFSF